MEALELLAEVKREKHALDEQERNIKLTVGGTHIVKLMNKYLSLRSLEEFSNSIEQTKKENKIGDVFYSTMVREVKYDIKIVDNSEITSLYCYDIKSFINEITDEKAKMFLQNLLEELESIIIDNSLTIYNMIKSHKKYKISDRINSSGYDQIYFYGKSKKLSFRIVAVKRDTTM